MVNEDKINLVARVARSIARGEGSEGAAVKPGSILSLAAASYGSRPTDESTIPTGFDPAAVALFEGIVEAAYLVASADGVFDDEERKTFERVVTTACGGTVPPNHIEGLVTDLSDQLAEDGLDRRIQALSERVHKPEQAVEVLRIAALLAQVSDDVSGVERSVLVKIAAACKLEEAEVENALRSVKEALTAG